MITPLCTMHRKAGKKNRKIMKKIYLYAIIYKLRVLAA